MASPLSQLRSIKVKLSIVIVAAVAVTLAVNELGIVLNFRAQFRAGVAALIALGMVQLLSRGMTSPLRSMERAATSMAAGNVAERIEVSSADEVGRLADAFNHMARELAEVDRQRRDLVANVSHELRTPISALRATLENVVDGVVEPDPTLLRTMLAQTERLQRLVTQLLDLSRLESGGTLLHRLPFLVAAMLEDVADEAALHSPRIEFRVDVQPIDLTLDGDPERLHQVFANLADNAARFTPDGGEVVLTARLVEGAVVMEVLDTGPGIPPEAASRVFERFYRTDEARSADEGGSGLGLAIARWIVELHGLSDGGGTAVSLRRRTDTRADPSPRQGWSGFVEQEVPGQHRVRSHLLGCRRVGVKGSVPAELGDAPHTQLHRADRPIQRGRAAHHAYEHRAIGFHHGQGAGPSRDAQRACGQREQNRLGPGWRGDPAPSSVHPQADCPPEPRHLSHQTRSQPDAADLDRHGPI